MQKGWEFVRYSSLANARNPMGMISFNTSGLIFISHDYQKTSWVSVGNGKCASNVGRLLAFFKEWLPLLLQTKPVVATRV